MAFNLNPTVLWTNLFQMQASLNKWQELLWHALQIWPFKEVRSRRFIFQDPNVIILVQFTLYCSKNTIIPAITHLRNSSKFWMKGLLNCDLWISKLAKTKYNKYGLNCLLNIDFFSATSAFFRSFVSNFLHYSKPNTCIKRAWHYRK